MTALLPRTGQTGNNYIRLGKYNNTFKYFVQIHITIIKLSVKLSTRSLLRQKSALHSHRLANIEESF